MPIRGFAQTPQNTREWGKFFRETTVMADAVDENTEGLVEAIEDATAALIQNGVGITWAYSDASDPATLTGTVSLAPFSTTNLAEGANLYYTAARFDTAFAAKSTTDLAEGTNLYFTDERAQDAVGATLTDSSSVDFTYTDGSGQITAVVLPAGVNHNSLLNYVADEHIAHSGVTLTAGAGLTGGGTIAANRTFTVGAGTGITVNADDVAVSLGATFPWTNQHTYSLAGNLATPTILMTSTQPVLAFDETDQGSDEKRWAVAPVAKAFQLRSATDSGGASIIWFSALRGTGTAIASITIGDNTNNNTYSFSSTGLATFAGSVSAGTFIPTAGAAPSNGLYLPSSNTPAISSNSGLAMSWDSSKNALGKAAIRSDSATAGVGYATGAGGTVTQATSRTTGVTLNKVCGAITLVSAAGLVTWQSFTVTNSAVAATDVIVVNQKSGTDKNMIHVTAVAAGSFEISFATTGGVIVEQPVFNFAVVKAVAA